MTPSARSLAHCRAHDIPAQVVERYNPHCRRRVDLFGVIDIVAITSVGILGIQATSGTNHAARRTKALAEPRLKAWIAAGGRFEIWSWRKAGKRGGRKTWTVRVEAVTAEDFAKEAV